MERVLAGEQFAQAMYTLAFMHGTVGREGSYVSWQGLCDMHGLKLAGFESDCSQTDFEPNFYPSPW